jgi:hypothetical protein
MPGATVYMFMYTSHSLIHIQRNFPGYFNFIRICTAVGARTTKHWDVHSCCLFGGQNSRCQIARKFAFVNLAAKLATNWRFVCFTRNPTSSLAGTKYQVACTSSHELVLASHSSSYHCATGGNFPAKPRCALEQVNVYSGWHGEQSNHQGLLFASLIVCCLNTLKPAPQSTQPTASSVSSFPTCPKAKTDG